MSGVLFGLEDTSNVTMTESHFKQHLISSISHSLPFKFKISSPYPGLLTFLFMFALYSLQVPSSARAAQDVLGQWYSKERVAVCHQRALLGSIWVFQAGHVSQHAVCLPFNNPPHTPR